jgi:hypothetical protein
MTGGVYSFLVVSCDFTTRLFDRVSTQHQQYLVRFLRSCPNIKEDITSKSIYTLERVSRDQIPKSEAVQ